MRPRPIRIDGAVAFVPLTQGYEAVIDAADVSLVDCWNWCAQVKPRSVYARRIQIIDGKAHLFIMHRCIIDCPSDMLADHRNGNGLDNRRANLRIATSSQNNHNQRIRHDNTSGFKGVHFHKRSKKWCARIKINNKPINIGLFTTPEDAYAAYCASSARIHGDFGRTE